MPAAAPGGERIRLQGFHRLGPADLSRIAGLLLNRSAARMRALGMRLEVTDGARELLARPGARPLRHTVASELDDRLDALLRDGEARPGDTVVADERDGHVVCSTVWEAEQAAEAEGMPPPPMS